MLAGIYKVKLLDYQNACKVKSLYFLRLVLILLSFIFGGVQSVRAALDVIPDNYKVYAGHGYHLSKAPISFKAHDLSYDGKLNLVIAKGGVVIKQGSLTIFADQAYISYSASYLIAKGNVYLKAPGKNMYADEARIDSKVNKIIINNVKIILADHSVLGVKNFTKTGHINEGLDIAYTACPVDKYFRPFWSITASKVKYNDQSKLIELYNGWLKIKSIPVFWLPYTSYADPLIKRKTGFISPDAGVYSEVGYYLALPFYIPIGLHQNLVLEPTFFKKSLFGSDNIDEHSIDVLLSSKYHAYFYNGEVDIAGYWTPLRREEAAVFSNIKFDINSKFRLNAIFNNTSTPEFINKYLIQGFSTNPQPFMWQTLDVEGFLSDNNYLDIKLDITHNNSLAQLPPAERKVKNPYTLPHITFHHFGEVHPYGRFDFNFEYTNFLGTDTKDKKLLFTVDKLVNRLNYNYQKTNSFGLIKLSSNVQWVNYYEASNSSGRPTGADGYLGAGGSLTYTYPFFSVIKRVNSIFEPMVQLATSSYVYKPKKDLDMFDKNNLEINIYNLFEDNKYTGTDNYEDTNRLNYGIRWRFIGQDGFSGQVALGQSKELLSSQMSNYLVYVSLHPVNYFKVDYMGSLSFDPHLFNQHNLIVSLGNELIGTTLNYSSISNLDPQAFEDPNPRELGASIYMQLGSGFRISANGTLNLKHDVEASVNHGLWSHLNNFGSDVEWHNSCFKAVFRINRNFYGTSHEQASTSYQASFIFKNLGGT